ncbi:MAG TPA: hypothetical protein VH560_12230 [Polyangia bacterium]|jgi:hypothetical protein|nr:hypothetical protein [Polyangia bacterium]
MKSRYRFALARHVARAALLGSALVACGSNGPTGTPGTAGASGSAGVGNGSAGASASAGATGSAGANGSAGATGSAGASASAGANGSAGSASAGAGGAQGNPDSGTALDGNAGDFPSGTCGAGSIFCDDFESYKIQGAFNCPAPNGLCDFIPTGSTMETWLGYHFHGPPYLVAGNVFGGKQVYQLDHEVGHAEATDIIKESPDGVDLWPAAHYGRVMVYLKSLPVTGSVGLMTESGLLAGSTTNTAQYTLGATNGKLSFSYMQRKRPFKNDVSKPLMRIGGNWENATEAPTTYCTVSATTATIAAGKWVCVEWMVDRTKPELHVWLDGAATADLDVSGGGGTCSVGTAATWTGPEHFTELDLGWEINGNDAGGSPVQYDMFAIGTQKLGCPAM